MKAFLMFEDRDFDLERELPPNADALIQDLELNTLFEAMAAGDEFLFDVARKAALSSVRDPQAILYRQHILADCLEHASIVRDVYALAVESIEGERKAYWGGLSKWSSPDTILHRSVAVLEHFVGMLRKVRRVADEHGGKFRSEGFARFFAMLEEELDDGYFQRIEDHLRQLKFRNGALISAELGRANKGIRYLLRRSPEQHGWLERIFARDRRPAYSFQIADRDEAGARALEELRGRGINSVANALAQSTDHILSFFVMLRSELAFYIGCLNLHARLGDKGEPTCFPVPSRPEEPALSFRGLYDACLTLHVQTRVVGNDVSADGKRLVMITGANQGGKSTFLRSVGLAQVMVQCGMFVPAERFSANVCDGVFTHYRREEDAAMESGKLDEELKRMSDIADLITPNSLLLCNESFASTNEREGSEIARQVIRALLEASIKVFVVTHLFDLARGFYDESMETALFLRAERRADGRRTFRLVKGEPLPTSHGADVYGRLFGVAPPAAPAAPAARSDVGR
ncbi:MAG: DNA mismatch repair protein MutS [Actinomycetota bacterium]